MADALNQVDLAFVVDTTGSMGAFIDETAAKSIAREDGHTRPSA